MEKTIGFIKQAYRDIFGVTLIKTSAVFVVIAVYYAVGLV